MLLRTHRLPKPTGRLLLCILSTVLLAGCFALYEQRYPDSPRRPPPPRKGRPAGPGLVYIPVDSHSHYVVDGRRGLCFFASSAGGKSTMAQVDCQDIPEAIEILRKQGFDVGDDGRQPQTTPPAASQPQTQAAAVSETDKKRYARAYAEVFCLMRKGEHTAEKLKKIYRKYGFTEEQYREFGQNLSTDRTFWDKLTNSAVKQCPK